MFKDLSLFSKVCLGVTIAEVIVIYGGMTVAYFMLKDKAEDIMKSIENDVNRIKEETSR